jgi:hypothetical protein
MKTPFKEQDLPLADMEKLGLYKNGQWLIDRENLDALLAGRRTELISLHELKADGFEIDRLDAKLSVTPEWDGRLTLNIHPIYKEPKLHPLLLEHEAQVLIDGQIDTLQKIYQNGDKRKIYNFEYDPETKEFIDYDPANVIVPQSINTYQLTEKQKDAFRNGEVISLGDGTQVQYRANDRKGIRADRAALVMSVLLDGGISYLLVRGIKNLLNNDTPQKDENTQAYLKAVDELQQKMKQASDQQQNNEQVNEENRGYTKTRSR